MNPLIFVGIGEVLYDVFEDGTETLGGAPLNFAVHAHQLASQLGVGHGIIVSCINSDQRGYKIIDSLHRLGMSTRYVGKDSSHPTGLVSVFMRNGEPGYQIEAGAAWDYMTDQASTQGIGRSVSCRMLWQPGTAIPCIPRYDPKFSAECSAGNPPLRRQSEAKYVDR